MGRTSIIASAVAVAFVFIWVACSFGQTIPENPAKGAHLFASKGWRGEQGKIGPDLSHKDLGDTRLNLAARIWNHTPSMMAEMESMGITKPTPTGEDFVDISAYLYFLRFFDEAGNKARGERLFSVIGCGQCHGPDRNSDKLMFLNLSKYEAVSEMEIVAGMWNHSTQIQKAVGEQNMA